MRKLFSMVDRLGDSDVSVLITGESGVGKELVARSLHGQRSEADGPFVAVNCAAVPANLIESELFGHVRGAFTDAKRSRDGLFVRADGGTLFLDEIGELPMEIQPKLLRVLQECRVTPVGGEREIPFDARIICATNRDLEEDVENGRFREDLFYRVNVVRLHVPPLRARGTDVLLLAQHFIDEAARRSGRKVRGLSSAAAAKLMAYDWPGTVRQLENAMERGVALAQLEEIQVEDLPPPVRAYQPSDLVVTGSDPSELLTLDELEARYIRRVLEMVKGNKTRAAEILGVGRRTLYRRLERIEEEADLDTEGRVSI
jgi:two-component system response regulator HydG